MRASKHGYATDPRDLLDPQLVNVLIQAGRSGLFDGARIEMVSKGPLAKQDYVKALQDVDAVHCTFEANSRKVEQSIRAKEQWLKEKKATLSGHEIERVKKEHQQKRTRIQDVAKKFIRVQQPLRILAALPPEELDGFGKTIVAQQSAHDLERGQKGSEAKASTEAAAKTQLSQTPKYTLHVAAKKASLTDIEFNMLLMAASLAFSKTTMTDIQKTVERKVIVAFEIHGSTDGKERLRLREELFNEYRRLTSTGSEKLLALRGQYAKDFAARSTREES